MNTCPATCAGSCARPSVRRSKTRPLRSTWRPSLPPSPKDLDASEIEVRLGATWIDKEYIQQFMYETFDTPFYLQRSIEVHILLCIYR